MTVEHQYILWLQQMIDPSRSFGLLTWKLYSMAYEWNMPIDENLEWLGINLRERFMKECDIYDMSGMAIVLTHHCSIVEVLCGIAWDVSDRIFSLVDNHSITALCYYDLITYLELDMQFDENFDAIYVEKAIRKNFYNNFFGKSRMFLFQNFIYEKYFLNEN